MKCVSLVLFSELFEESLCLQEALGKFSSQNLSFI